MSADFVSTSQLQQLEELLIKRRSPLYLVLRLPAGAHHQIGSVASFTGGTHRVQS